jgi:hypothetical protein
MVSGGNVMETNILMVFIVNAVYLAIWYAVYKIRTSKRKELRIWDNGYEFFDSLDNGVKERYWKEDTKIIHTFFIIFLFFLEITLFLYYIDSTKLYWIISLSIGIVASVSVAMILSVKLQKKFRSREKK